MGKKDIFERELTKNLEVVADLINLIVYGGRKVVLASELQILPGDQTYIDSDDDLRELRRDRYILWTRNGVVFAFFGLESQTAIDPDMPLRGFAYDGNSYREQLKNKDGKRRPVITFVLYFGDDPWTNNLTLSERLQATSELPEEFKPFFNDYHVNVNDVRRLKPEDIQKLRSVFKYIASWLYGLEHRDAGVALPPVEYQGSDGELIAMFFKTLTNNDDLRWIPVDKLKKGKATMNQLLEAMVEPKREAIREEGREEGIVIGREEGIVIGLKKGREEERQKSEQEKRTTASKLSLMGLSSDQIAEAIGVDPIVVESWLAGN